MTPLKDFINYYCKLSNDELDFVVSKFHFKGISKGKHILIKGQICNEFVYTINGNFRIYYKDAVGREITTWIVFEDMLATELTSFITQEPSDYYVEAIADSEIASLNYNQLQLLYNELPKFQEFGRKIAEEVVVGAIKRVVSFQHEPADVRYNKIL